MFKEDVLTNVMGKAARPIAKARKKFTISKDVRTKLKNKKATDFNLYASGSAIFFLSSNGKNDINALNEIKIVGASNLRNN